MEAKDVKKEMCELCVQKCAQSGLKEAIKQLEEAMKLAYYDNVKVVLCEIVSIIGTYECLTMEKILTRTRGTVESLSSRTTTGRAIRRMRRFLTEESKLAVEILLAELKAVDEIN